MPDDHLPELQIVASLQESLLTRQRVLKSKIPPLEPLDVSAHVSALLHALDAVTSTHGLESLDRLEKQTQVLTTLALLFALVRIDEVHASEEYVLRSLEAAWSLWPPAGAGMTILRCRELMRNVIRLPGGGQSCVRRLLQLCKDVPLGTKRVLACLQELLDAGEHAAVEAIFPDLVQRCLNLLHRTDVSTAAGRLCVSLISSKLSPQSADFGPFVPWLKEALCRGSGSDRALAASHLLPLLVKSRPKLFEALFSVIVATGEDLDCVLALARSGFAAGLIRREELPDEILQAAMRHCDPKLRASVVVLLSDAPSTALRFSTVDFGILEAFFKYDMGPTDGDFRQSTSAAWMRILIRLRTSVYGANRNAVSAAKKGAPDKAAEVYIECVRGFLEAVLLRLRRALLPCSPYRVQRGGLQHLTTLLASGIDSTYKGELDKAAQKSVAQFQTQPGAGPLWPFELDLCDQRMIRILLRCLLSTYDDVREGAFALLLDMPKSFSKQAMDSLLMTAMALLRNRRESETASGALMAELAARLGADSVLDGIVQAAEEDVTLAEHDLAKAAQLNPIHGCLVGARRLYLADLASGLPVNSALHSRILHLCERVWAVVEPVLCHASPEGMEINGDVKDLADHEDARALHILQSGIEDDEDEKDDEIDDESVGGPRHKILLSAAWRSAKEAAALLETCLVQSANVGRLERAWDLASVQQIGQLFATWLLQIRHRGAFSAIYPSYGRMCRVLIEYKSWSAVSVIPLRLLDSHLESVRDGRTSTTRRSAGLPYCILGALSGIKSTAPEVVADCLRGLLKVAEGEQGGETSRVHAMNTLRILMGDAELAPLLVFFVEPCFALALRSLNSSSWSVRNVAMLLFASLAQRVLGARTSTLSTELQTGSKRTFSHDFFCRYPGLHPLILRELEQSSQQVLHRAPTLDMHSSLHAILLLLGLLSTPNRTVVSHEMCLAFVPALERCASSRVWRIREAAAQALAGLLSPDDVVERLQRMPVAGWLSTNLTNNELHGRLLQILAPLQRTRPLLAALGDWPREFDSTASHFFESRPLAVRASVLSIINVLSCLHDAPNPSVMAPAICHRVWRMLEPTSNVDCLSFVSEAAGIALHDQQKRAIELLLQSHSDVAVQLGLHALDAKLIDDKSERQLRKIVESSKDAQNCLMALEILSRIQSAAQGDHFNRLLSKYEQATALSLRLLLLPMLAASVQTHNHASTVLAIVSQVTDEDEDEEARQAGVRALLALPKAHTDSSAFQALRMRVLQDDDAAIRGNAETLAGSQPPIHALQQVEGCVRSIIGSLGADEALRQHVLNDAQTLLESLQGTDEALFAKERANLFKDDAFEIEAFSMVARTYRAGAWPATRQVLVQMLPRLREVTSQSQADASPFDLGCRPALGLLTLKISAAMRLTGFVADSEMYELVERTIATSL